MPLSSALKLTLTPLGLHEIRALWWDVGDSPRLRSFHDRAPEG